MPAPHTASAWVERFIAACPYPKQIAEFEHGLILAWEKDKWLPTSLPETAAQNLTILSKLLDTSLPETVRLANRYPVLFYQRPENVYGRAARTAALVGWSVSQLVRKQPRAMNRDPKSVKQALHYLAQTIGLSVSETAKVWQNTTSLYATSAQALRARVTAMAALLRITPRELLRTLKVAPSVLGRSPDAIEHLMTTLEQGFDAPRERVIAAIIRAPQILTHNPGTLLENHRTLAWLIDVNPADLSYAALKFPQILILDPLRMHERVITLANALNISVAETTTAMLRMPSLFSREPLMMARKVRLVVRIAAILGRPSSPAEILLKCPAVPTYGMDRLLVRWLIARLGLWTWNWVSLAVRSDSVCLSLLQQYADELPQKSLARRRLALIVQRRMKSAVIT